VTAAELRTILAHVGDDEVVHIRSRHCSHVETVERQWMGDGVAVVLGGDTLWMDPEPEFVVHSTLLRKRELFAELDDLDSALPEGVAT